MIFRVNNLSTLVPIQNLFHPDIPLTTKANTFYNFEQPGNYGNNCPPEFHNIAKISTPSFMQKRAGIVGCPIIPAQFFNN
jgi:hypothetical protein